MVRNGAIKCIEECPITVMATALALRLSASCMRTILSEVLVNFMHGSPSRVDLARAA